MQERKKFKSVAYRPKVHTSGSMDEGLKRAFKGAKESSSKGFGGGFGKNTKPIGFGKPAQIQQREQQSRAGQPYRPPNMWAPKSEAPQAPAQQQSEQKPTAEEEPYWSAEEWEEWAYDLYANYPEVREILPEWFIEAVETEPEE